MILWLASYPKSGNTFLRSFLSTFFFSEDGVFNFELLDNIKQYPQPAFFYKLGININDKHEVAKSHIEAQKLINQGKKSFKFLKTHSGFVKMDGFSFTDLSNSLGVIYVVRDPRDVLISFAHHNDETIEETSKKIKDNYIIDGDTKNKIPVYMGSWAFHYNSWKEFKKNDRYFLIKYEDLILNKKRNFKKILNFIKKLTNAQFEIQDQKIEKIIKQIEFNSLKKLEQKVGFKEARKDKKGNKINFFREGKTKEWQKKLDPKIRNSIEIVCEKEMKELGYL
tara:strand:+ start:4874 stop:5713 length:840 start_codon:yes stop_codon:yes gene_type:complete